MGNLAYVGECSGQFWAIEIDTGLAAWIYDISWDGDQYNFHGDPLVYDNMILTGCDGVSTGHLYAFDREYGEVLWKVENERGFATNLVRSENQVFAVSMNDELYAVGLDDGAIHWRLKGGFANNERNWSSSPVVSNDRVYFGSGTGTVYGLQTETGDTLWQLGLDSRATTDLLLVGSDLFLGTANGVVYLVNQSDGTVDASLELPTAALKRPLMTPSGIVVLGATGAELYCIEPSLDSVVWLAPSGGQWSSHRPQLWHDLVLAGEDHGVLHAIDHTSGQTVWSEQFDGAVRGIGITDSVIFVGTLSGNLYAYRPPDAGN